MGQRIGTGRSVVQRVWRHVQQRLGGRQRTVSQGWDDYAAAHEHETDGHLGDEWNEPERIGLDVESPDLVVPYLDKRVIEPFFGQCEVMLEIGPGGGRFTEVLLPKCRRLIAADTSAAMLSLLRKRFRQDERLEYLRLDGSGLAGVPDDSVDAAFSYGVFVHLQHWDIYHYLTELKRVLRPGGKALIQHANSFSQLGWQTFLQHVPLSLNRHKLPWTFTLMTPGIMKELVQRAGLEMEKCITELAKRDCISLIRVASAR